MKLIKSRALAGLLSIALITLLILAGPAEAFLIGFTLSNSSPIKGEVVNFEVSIQLQDGDSANIQEFNLVLNGQQSRTCKFSPNGAPISGCSNFNIKVIELPENNENGYGYGYYSGSYRYNITLETKNLPIGDYTIRLIGMLPDKEIKSSDKSIKIISKPLQISGCSIRAKDGQLSLNNFTDNKNELTLKAPLENAKSGSGSFTTQKGRDRYAYEFEIKDSQKNADGTFTFNVSGNIRKGLDKGTKLDSTIIFNPSNMKVNVISSSLNVKDMNVNFFKC